MDNNKGRYSYELIQDYLDGILDQKTSQGVRDILKNDETARDIAKGILLLQEKFDDDEIEDYLNKRLEANQNVISNHTFPERNAFIWLKYVAAIAFLVVSSLLVFQFMQPDLSDLVAREMSKPYMVAAVLRNNETTELSKAFSAYLEEDYTIAIKYFGVSSGIEALFYGGLCHLYLGDYQLAASVLESKELIGSRFEEQSRWYVALAYLKAGDREKAREVLNEIIKSRGHYKHNEAEQLIKLIGE